MGVGTEIRAEMARRSITGVALAEATGLKRPYLSQRLNEHADLRVDELRRIGAAIGVAASTILKRVEQAETDAAAALAGPTDAVALAGSATHLSADEAEGPTEAELEAHVEACDSCTCAEDALDHARQAAEEVA